MGLFFSWCTVAIKWLCTRPHVLTQGYLYVSFCIFSLVWNLAKQSCPNYCHLYLGPDLVTDAVAPRGSFLGIQTVGTGC